MANVSRKQLAEIIGEKTLQIKDTDTLAQEIAGFFASSSHGQMDIDSLMRDVMKYRQNHGFVEATAVSAHALDDRIIADVRDLLSEHFPDAKHIKINNRTDKDIVGGVRIDLPAESLDLSIRSKLNTFKKLVAKERF